MNLDGSCNLFFILVNPTRVKLNASSHTQTCIQVATSQPEGFRPHNPPRELVCNVATCEQTSSSTVVLVLQLFSFSKFDPGHVGERTAYAPVLSEYWFFLIPGGPVIEIF